MEDQRLLVQRSWAARALGFPRGHVRIIGIVAQSLALGRLVLLAEMRTTGFVAVERISAHQFAEFKEVGYAAGFLEGLVEFLVRAQHAYVSPEVFAQFRNHAGRFLQTGG